MNSESVVSKAEEIYSKLQKNGISVLYDDRTDASPGFKFKDADLLGMPLQVIVGEKNLKNGQIEMKDRNSGERRTVAVDTIIEEVIKFIKG